VEKYTFYNCLQSKYNTVEAVKYFFLIIVFGLIAVALFTKMGNLYPHIGAGIILIIFFEILEFQIEKCWKEPEKLVVYDSYISHKIRGHYDRERHTSTPSRIYVKKDNGRSFSVNISEKDWYEFSENDRVLAINIFLLGGILITEEDCQRINFKEIIVVEDPPDASDMFPPWDL
jgi:hypothetical protein